MNAKIVLSLAIGTALGAAAGYFVGHFLAKKKYKKQLEESQDAMMKIAKNYEDKYNEFNTYKEAVNDLNYNHAETEKPKNEEKDRKMDGVKLNDSIYILHPDAYYYDDKYPHEDLVYYEEDEILADGAGQVVDIDDTVTIDGLKNIGFYEEDAVHVLNKKSGVAYNVVRSSDHYTDIPPEWGYDG
jgi:hypothetical protein